MRSRNLPQPPLLGLLACFFALAWGALAAAGPAPAEGPRTPSQPQTVSPAVEPAASAPSAREEQQAKESALTGAAARAGEASSQESAADKQVADKQVADEKAADEKAADKKAASKKKEAERKRKKELEKQREELETQARELRYAQFELRIAVHAQESEGGAAELAQASARRKLGAAEEALARFETFELPLERQVQQLAIDKAERKLTEAREELDGILAIYAEEETALARDAVVGRHRAALEFAGRELELARFKARQMLEGELVGKQRRLQGEIEEARGGLQQAQREQRKSLEGAELEVLRKGDAVEQLGLEVQELQASIEALEKQA